MIKINNVAIPAPTDYTVGIQDITKADRNARGTMIMEIIATKRKLDLMWMHLTKSEYQQLLNLVAPAFFNVEYPDPQTGNLRTGVFYVGDRTIGGLTYKDGEMQWRDIKFNVIER